MCDKHFPKVVDDGISLILVYKTQSMCIFWYTYYKCVSVCVGFTARYK